jgi:hypothetical protein
MIRRWSPLGLRWSKRSRPYTNIREFTAARVPRIYGNGSGWGPKLFVIAEASLQWWVTPNRASEGGVDSEWKDRYVSPDAALEALEQRISPH